MDLTYSEEQLMLKDSINAFLTKDYGPVHSGATSRMETGRDGAFWRRFADLGWLALPIPEQYGGLGGSAIETALLMEGFGRHLVMEPWLPACILGAGAIARFGADDHRAMLLPDIAAGNAYPALAHIERQAGYDLTHVSTRADRTASGYRLTGGKTHVLGAAGAGCFLVSARFDNEPSSGSGIGLCIVPPDAKGLSIDAYRLIDGSRAVRLTLEKVEVGAREVLAHDIDPGELEALFDTATAALLADSVGAMEALLETTVEYLKQRTQFGKPLSQFQALRHRVAEMKIRCEEARAAMMLASLSLEKPQAFRIRSICGAKITISRGAKLVAQEAMQLHGAMGVSEETSVGRWFKRLQVNEATFGSTLHHLKRYSAAITTDGAARRGLLESAAA